jgi:hypothetical protein
MSYPRLTNLYQGAGRTVLIIVWSQPRSWTLQPSQDVSLGCGLDRVSTFSCWTAIRVAPYGGRRPRCRGQFFALGAATPCATSCGQQPQTLATLYRRGVRSAAVHSFLKWSTFAWWHAIALNSSGYCFQLPARQRNLAASRLRR